MQTPNHLDASCLSVCLSLGDVGLYIRRNWMRALGLQVVTSKRWTSVTAGLVPPRWGRIKGVIDKCDMLIRGQMEEKIPLSGHEGTPRGSCFRGGCHFNSRTSTADLPSKRKEMMVIRCSCFWTLFMTVRSLSRLDRNAFFVGYFSRQCWKCGVFNLTYSHCVILQISWFMHSVQTSWKHLFGVNWYN